MERNLLLTIRYDGSAFCGWQVQKNGISVMETLQNSIEKTLKERPPVKGCSRTDSGVHGENYCVSFRTSNRIPTDRIPTALNCNLPDEIAVLSCKEVESEFHARYNALAKIYTYRVLNSPVRDPFWAKRAMYTPYYVDVDSVNEQAKAFLGTHDFSAFCNIGGTTLDNIRTIYGFNAVRKGDIVEMQVCGNGFLYNMVRIMMGTLINIETGLLDKNIISDIIKSKDRQNAGMTAPACGLYLTKVFYDESFKEIYPGVENEKEIGI